jgi:8-hydroxy-5-deazaflavin:NADPH oxidoreductase
MRIGVLGTGVVGQTLASAWIAGGHEVMLGSRTTDNEAATAWATGGGETATNGTFVDAATHGEVVVNCTPGEVTLSILADIGADVLSGKVLIDVANALDFSEGFPPTLSIVNIDSLGERVQRALPTTRVVKALNTMTAAVMADPARLDGRHDLFIAGDDEQAKRFVRSMLAEFGWSDDDIHDLGGIEAARGTEMYLPLWLRLMTTLGSAEFNIHVVQSTGPSE